MDVANAMNYLHNQSPEPILHRDLKSSNMLVTEDLRIKVSDFGLARVKDNRYKPTHPLDVCIQAPEVLQSRMVYTEKSDTYSYGLLLWELVTVKVPYEGMNPQDIVVGVLTKQMRPTLPCNCSTPLRILIERCWDETPQNRPTFQDIIKELRAMTEI